MTDPKEHKEQDMKRPYRENPKTAGSGIVCCIPQTGRCPNNCPDCFFQGGRSYLEPLGECLPNMPDPGGVQHRVVRVNDGNDSNVDRGRVVEAVQQYPLRFYNTALPDDIGGFDAPVVLTVNPGTMTDRESILLSEIPPNLMFVRARANTWNFRVVDEVVGHYTAKEVPIVLTFMAYFKSPVPKAQRPFYVYRKRTLNSYWAITTVAWNMAMERYKDNIGVYSCGKIEGERGDTKCRRCGNCLREFFAARERMGATDGD